MLETLEALTRHLGPGSKIDVLAHNSHIGDARATQMGTSGELNIGQLARERYRNLVGFTTHTGTVTAASEWNAPAERKRVRLALDGSYEALFHATQIPNFLLQLRSAAWLSGVLNQERLERAIGVIYLPETERGSHYFSARLANQLTTWSTWMQHEPSNRWSEHLSGGQVSFRRHVRLLSKRCALRFLGRSKRQPYAKRKIQC